MECGARRSCGRPRGSRQVHVGSCLDTRPRPRGSRNAHRLYRTRGNSVRSVWARANLRRTLASSLTRLDRRGSGCSRARSGRTDGTRRACATRTPARITRFWHDLRAVRRLYLLRHAKSSWDDPSLADHDRPLAPRGRKASKRIAKHVRNEKIRPDLVLCSSSARTQATLERIRPELGKKVQIELDDVVYMATPPELVERLRTVAGGVESVMIIGHNPGFNSSRWRSQRRVNTSPDCARSSRREPWPRSIWRSTVGTMWALRSAS